MEDTVYQKKKAKTRKEVLKNGQSRSNVKGNVSVSKEGEVRRVKRALASDLVTKGWKYCSRGAYRAYKSGTTAAVVAEQAQTPVISEEKAMVIAVDEVKKMRKEKKTKKEAK